MSAALASEFHHGDYYYYIRSRKQDELWTASHFLYAQSGKYSSELQINDWDYAVYFSFILCKLTPKPKPQTSLLNPPVLNQFSESQKNMV